MTTAAMGHQAKLGIKKESSYGTAVVPDTGLVFVSESIKKSGVIIERNGIRGTRSHVSDDTRTGPYSVGGTLVLEPTPQDLAVFLPLILGANASGTTYALAETLQSFTMTVDRVTDRFTYQSCVVSRATFSGQKGGLLQLSMDIVAQKEGKIISNAFSEGMSGTADAMSLTPSVTTPFQFSGDLIMTLQSSARETDFFEVTIDNGVVADRFMNALTITGAPTADRVITVRTSHPYASGNTDLYAQALAGAAGTLKLAQGSWASVGDSGYGMIFTFGTLQVPDNSPTVPSREEIMLGLEMVARKTGSTSELSIALDPTA